MLKETLLVCVLIRTLHYNIKHTHTFLHKEDYEKGNFSCHIINFWTKKREIYIYDRLRCVWKWCAGLGV